MAGAVIIMFYEPVRISIDGVAGEKHSLTLLKQRRKCINSYHVKSSEQLCPRTQVTSQDTVSLFSWLHAPADSPCGGKDAKETPGSHFTRLAALVEEQISFQMVPAQVLGKTLIGWG